MGAVPSVLLVVLEESDEQLPARPLQVQTQYVVMLTKPARIPVLGTGGEAYHLDEPAVVVGCGLVERGFRQGAREVAVKVAHLA